MKMIYTEEMTKNLVEAYYKKYEDFDCKLDIKCDVTNVGPIGRSIVPTRVARLSFTLKGKVNVDGVEGMGIVPASQEDIENAIKIMVESSGQAVKKISFDYDIDSENCRKGKFKGVSVEMSAKKKVKDK